MNAVSLELPGLSARVRGTGSTEEAAGLATTGGDKVDVKNPPDSRKDIIITPN